MDSVLEGYLFQMHSGTCSDMLEQIKDIKDIVSKTRDNSVVSVLLSKENGLIFLVSKFRDSKKDENFAEVIKCALSILGDLLEKFGESMSNHLVVIKNLALMYMNSKNSKIRGACYFVLCQVVITAQNSPTEILEELNLPALSNMLFEKMATSSDDSSSKAKMNFLVLLGKLAQYFPSTLTEKASRIINQLLYELEKEVKRKHDFKDKRVAGCIEALTGFLHSFNSIVDQNCREKIHSYLLMLLTKFLLVDKRVHTKKAALNMLEEHASFFNNLLLKQYQSWFDSLKSYALREKTDILESGLKALRKFIDESIKILKIASDAIHKSIILEFFMKNVIEILESDQASLQLKSVGLKALGECSFLVSGKNVSHILEYLLNKTSFICIQEDTSKSLDLFPICLESLGLVLMRYATPIGIERTQQLQKMLVHLFSRYLDIAERNRCGRSVAVFLVGVHAAVENSIDFSAFVREVVIQSLIRSTRPELDCDSIKKYASLWITIMNFSCQTDLPFSLEDRVRVLEVLDGQLVTAISTIVSRLNFSVNEMEDSTVDVEKTESCPRNPADWQLFHNLADLLDDLLKVIEPRKRLQDLLIPFGREVVELSTKFPLVPGLYRVVALVLFIIGQDLPGIHHPTYEMYMSSLINRLAQLSDDVHVSAVQAVLSSPAWLVTSLSSSVTGALASALKIGLTYPPMAEWPLNALEHWQTALSFSCFDPIMEDILPLLEPYLSSMEKFTKEVPFISGKRLTRSKANATPTIDREAWANIQRRIVKLLGRMGPKCSRLVHQNEDHVIAHSATGWQISGHLEFGLPLSDMKPIIQLDAFLPRILHLVQHTSESETRMAACEFLHASILFLTGTISRRTEEMQLRYPLTALYSKSFPVILLLAVDSDEVIRQLFHTLLFQLVHWFSRPAFCQKKSIGRRTVLGAETVALLEQLMESACSGLDTSSVRDLACDCLLEFLKWTVKQSSDEILWEGPAVPDFIFQKLRASATHPSPHQRLGAAIVVNKLYRLIREYEPLTSIYTLDLLTHFVLCLSLAEQDAPSLGTVHESKKVLYNLMRTVMLKKNLFENPDARRRVAPFMNQGTLSELLEILLEHIFGSQQHCRHICVELCEILARPHSLTEVVTQFLSRRPLENLLPRKFPFLARLDVYRILLRFDVIETSKCDTDANSLMQFEVFVENIERKLEEKSSNMEVPLSDGRITESFMAWIGFLTEYLRKSQNCRFLYVKTLVRASLFPSRLGFSVHTAGSRQQLYTCLETQLFPLLSQHNEAILSVLTEFQLDRFDFAERQSLDIVRGFVLIATSGCMGANVSYCKSPTALLKMAVDNIVNNDEALLNRSQINTGSDSFSVRLKSSSMLMELALLLGLKIEILANEFRNSANIPNSAVTYGQYLCTKLGKLVLPIVVRQLKSMQPFLPQIGNGDSHQWTLLLELLQVAHQSLELSKKKWIVQNVLHSWSVLERHAEDYRQKCHLQSIVNCIANIDIDLVGRNSDVKRWIISCWNPSTDVNFASELVQLLNIFIANCSEFEENSLTSSLQNFFTHNFPSKTTGLEKNSDKTTYYSIVNRMIGIIRVPVVFHFLVDVFALEPRHSCVPAFMESVQNEDWEKSTCRHSLNQALTKLYQHAKMRTINPKTRIDEIEMLYEPLLMALPSSVVEDHLNGLLPDVLQMYDNTGTGTELYTQKSALCALLAVALVRVDYQRLSTYLNANFCALKKAQQPSDDGKGLMKCLMQFVLNIRKIVVPGNNYEVETFENLERFAFKLMLAIALITPSIDEVRVDRLIFKPMSQKIALWNAVVGTVRKYNLTVEVERHRKRFLVYIPAVSAENRPNKGYIPSQFLFGSSLSEDVYRFDFNQASLSTDFGSYDGSRNASVSSPKNEEASSSFLYLTLDDLNKHPCMGLLVNFLEKCYAKQTVLADSEPEWMNSLRETLLNPSAHTNVVLFIVRLVINLKSIFQPYAKFWYKSLLIAFLRKIGGEPLNSLFREGLDVVLEWSKDKPPSVDNVEFTQAASNVLQFILKNMYNANSEILRDNVEMLTAIFCVWDKISLSIPYEIVEELLSSDKKKAKLGLQILDVIAVHGFLPKNQEQNSRLKQRLANILKLDEKRDMNRSCAALCGSILSRETDKDFEKLVCEALQMWHNKNKDDVFVDLLYEVAIRYRPVLSQFAGINLSLFGSIYGTLRANCLEILAISWNFMEDPWKEIGFKTIESVLKGSNSAELCPVLSLVKDLIPRLEINEWKPLWPTLIRLSRHENIECRSRLYEVFKKAFDLSDSRDPDFAQAILRACTDEDKELAVKMQNFLAEKLPNSTMDRLLVYVTDFYAPGSEDYFLPYSLHFLLERTTHSHIYRESIFDQPLDDIPFQLLDLASLSSQSPSQRPSWNNFGRSFSYGSIQPGFLRATQSISNRATFISNPSPANWLMVETQSAEPSFTSQMAGETSLQNPVKETFQSPLKSWKRFTATGPPPVKLSYENRLKSKRETSTSSQPTLYRKYRIGELPDIQIPPSSLIAPLCAVALNDAALAKALFCHLLSAFRKQIKEIQGDDSEFALKLNTALESIVERHQPRSSNSNLLAAIMEYFWTNSVHVVTDIEKLTQSIKASHLQSLGILVIESCLPDCLVLEPSKKPRLEMVKHESSDWFHVADLYGDIQDVDNVRAVVTYLTGCNNSTKKAIESESKHDWNNAFQYYSQTLGDVSPPPEIKFCREYGFKCLEELGRWDEISCLKPKMEPWNIRSRVRNSLKNFPAGHKIKELDSVHLPSVDPMLLTDLAALALRNGNRDRATTCISKATDELISRYSQLSSLNFGGRQNLLQHVCIITEIETFLHQSEIPKNLSLPHTGDNVVVWDSILALRTFFTQCDKKKSNVASVNSLRLQLASIAIEQKNVGLARKLVDGAVDIHDPAMMSLRYLMQSKVLAMEALASDLELIKLGGLISAKETINRAAVTTTSSSSEEVLWKLDRERFEAFLCAQVFQVVNNMQPQDLITKQTKLIELWNVQPINGIIREGLQHAERQIRLAEIECVAANMSEAYLNLAKYFYKWKTTMSDEDYNIGLTRSVLASMRYGSVEGQALFPLVILAVKDNSSAANVFLSSRSNVPTSMFLPWVNQLVSYFALSSAIAKLLIDVSERYPVHVKLPFGITRSTFNQEVLNMYETRSLEANLTADNSTWKMFLKSIDYLKPPERAARELLNSETCMKDFELFNAMYLNLPPPTATSSHGHIHHLFSVLYTSKFHEAFKTGRLSELGNLLLSFKKQTYSGRRSLKDYSPWLANYRPGSSFSNGLLELPGFKGNTLKVEAFRGEIEYLNSKQFPARLTFLVNGAVEYPVLVKHGEDVRQDERIIQLLNAIDVVLIRDVESKKRSLRIRTFQVIPISNSCGIFQWLTGTLTLKTFLETDLEYRSSSIAIKGDPIYTMWHSENVNYIMNTPQEKLMDNYFKLADRSYRYGLRGAMKKLCQSPEAYFYLRNRLAASHGTLCSALWILGVGDRHLSNFLISTRTGDIISIDYGMAFGMSTNQLPVPEVVPCRLTTQFQFLIPGLGLNGCIRESMIHTLRVAKEQSGSIMAALSVFVTEPTLDWLKHEETMAKRSQTKKLENNSALWAPVEFLLRTENLLNGFHPSKITCDDLEKNKIFSTTKGRKLLPLVVSVVQGTACPFTAVETKPDSAVNKRKIENTKGLQRTSMPKQGLTSDQQVECLIEQSTDPACLCRMFSGWEPWM